MSDPPLSAAVDAARLRRQLLSIAAGILAFALSPFSFNFSMPPFDVTILWSSIFPLICGMAYGWSYALLSGAAGLGAFFPFLLWPSNGWALPFVSAAYLFWYCCQAWFAQRRRERRAWWNHPYLAYLPSAAAYFGLVRGMFPLAFGWNPPPWRPEAYTSIANSVLDGFVVKDLVGMFSLVALATVLLRVNAARRLLGLPAAEEGRGNGKILAAGLAGSLAIWLALLAFDRIFLDGARIFGIFSSLQPRDASSLYILAVAGLAVSYALIAASEERYRGTAVVREAELRLRNVLEVLPVAVAISSPEGRIGFINRRFTEDFGYLPEDVPDFESWISLAYPDPEYRREVVGVWTASVAEAVARARSTPIQEVRIRCKDGSDRAAQVQMRPIGETFVTVLVDVTGERRAAAENQRLQHELAQSQKTESIGRLAGGIAHDFNNMLGVILGYSEEALRALAPADPMAGSFSQIAKAARRSAALTSQLLAFARKQVAAPRPLDLNQAVEASLDMLRRLIGEDVDLEFRPAPGPAVSLMDPSQLDQVLANLCVNARDAIEGPGRIRIGLGFLECPEGLEARGGKLPPGHYVALEVEDSGAGMDGKTMDRIFEPFFTTKARGKGTGLGLAMVYGISTQNGGAVDVRSRPGKGSAFTVYLPRLEAGAAADAEAAERELQELPSADEGGDARVLLVEDEEAILRLASLMLEGLGYRVLTARNADQALAFLSDADIGIDLLVTDMIMPGMSGRALFERALVLRPGLPCLYMSGYTADLLPPAEAGETPVHYLQKPFSRSQLQAKVKEALASAEGAGRSSVPAGPGLST